MTMTNGHDGPAYGSTAVQSTSGGACTLPETLLSSGTYSDTTGAAMTVYPDWAPWPYPHYRVYPAVHTTVTSPAQEKPHETVARALTEIAQATRALRESAEAMGVPVEAAALEEAIVARLRAAL